MKQIAITLIAVFLSSVCVIAKEGDTTPPNSSGHLATQGDPARLTVENDTITIHDIIGKTIAGKDTVMSMIRIKDVIRDDDGSLLATGGFYGTVFFGDSVVRSRGIYDCFAVRFAPSGELTFLRIRGTAGSEIGFGIAVGPQGTIYVVGTLDDSMYTSYKFPKTYQGTVGKDGFLLSYDPTSLYCNTKVIVSGPGMDGAFAVTTDIWGNVYVTGTFRETAIIGNTTCTASGNKGLGDVFMLKISSSGEYLITQTYGSEDADERGISIGVGYNSDIISIVFDINIPDAPLSDLYFSDYGMKREVYLEVCNACVEYYFKELNLKLEKNTTR